MSKPSDRCAMRICGGLRMCHDATTHAFVEPAPAPQPPADATSPVCGAHGEVWCHDPAGHAWPHEWRNVPAGPPVTGDGDASLDADVREILACDGLPDPSIPVYVNDRIVSAVRAGLARGRELEARDAVAGLCPNCDHRAFMHQKDGCRRRVEITNGKPGWCVCTLTPGDVAGEIARRAGGGTL